MSKLSLNSNIASLSAQRGLAKATESISDSLLRLSSGSRINKASDDSAGLFVSSLLTVNKRVANQAIRNLNEGVSYLNVAEGALNELSNIVTRIQELSEQAANGTYGDKQRAAIQSEVTSLQSEFNRIIKSTSFNGNTLLTGTTSKTVLQGGYGVQAQLNVQVGAASLGISNDETRAGDTIRISTDSNGTQRTSGATFAAAAKVTANGEFVGFSLDANQLVSNDTNGQFDVYVKNLATGNIELASQNITGGVGTGYSAFSDISADGRYVVFYSNSNNMVQNETNNQFDVFVRDLFTDSTRLVNYSPTTNTAGNSGSTSARISADGRYVFFDSTSSDLVIGDTNSNTDVFRKDLFTGVLDRVSTVSSVSADGRYVLFVSNSNNIISGVGPTHQVYMKDLSSDRTTLISSTSAGVQGNALSSRSAISDDGKYVAFGSTATNLVSGDTNAAEDVFLKNLTTGATTLISSSAAGVQGNGVSTLRSISADGRYVVFESAASNLVSGDTNGQVDVFRKDTTTGEIVRVSTASSGVESSGNTGIFGASISADGRKVAFISSATNLISNDTNSSIDVFVRDMSVTGIQEMSGMVVTTQVSARTTLDMAKKYQEELSQYRAGIGASLSRAETFVSNLKVQSENYDSASSRITDADVAEESSKLTNSKILQQIATNVLSQVNLQPRLVLTLLNGI
jgi:flagellin-like hook-associated protein FlgL